ncbi:zinc finger protein 567-like isoform X5 [Aricia agestis]|uniref:zinc finger protein 567-like isoform X5 n=1 Tax=Aricia agestis TaxID=91739 RepID=UPI001C203B25|nr:zinc finger protein 567-like isoform X5 [Aricia agestis]
MEPKTIEWRPGPAVCRCCLAEGCYKDISTEYFWMGKREVYAEMLSETLDLSIAYSTSGGPNSNSRLICEQCISKLRDATEFKRQVQECERTFIQWLDPGNSVADATATEVKLEQVKKEKNHNSDEDDDFNDQPDFGDDDGYDDLDDDVPLTKYASKTPKKEPVDLQDLLDNVKPTTKRKSTTTKDKSTAKKAKVSKEKATSSKPKPEKKKKEQKDSYFVERCNAKILVQYTTAYPFRLPEDNMVCMFCCDSFEDPSLFRQHMDQEHKTFKLSTAFAHVTEDYRRSIKVDVTDLRCRLCSERFENVSDIAEHLFKDHKQPIDLNVELGIKPFKLERDKLLCAICNTKCMCMKQLSRHLQTHFLKYTCEACGKSFATVTNLKKHISYSHTSQGKVCKKCKTTFTSMAEKRNHLSESKNCRQYMCTHCGERFVTWTTKLSHLREAHGAGRSYVCKECGESFEQRRKYRIHFKITHTEDNFSCSFCTRKFETKNDLQDHVVIHTKEKRFPCPSCSKSFPRRKNLIQHMWIHSESKRFCCTLCNKQFNQRVCWKMHMKSHHPELDNYDYMLNTEAQISLDGLKML